MLSPTQTRDRRKLRQRGQVDGALVVIWGGGWRPRQSQDATVSTTAFCQEQEFSVRPLGLCAHVPASPLCLGHVHHPTSTCGQD